MNDEMKKEQSETQKESLPTEREEPREIKSTVTLTAGYNFVGEYEIIEPIKAISGEADIYKVKKDNEIFILKLYRYGIEPKQELSEKIKKLSKLSPHHLIRIFQAGYSDKFERYYEIQEYTQLGNLGEWLKKISKFDYDNAKDIIREINEAIHYLHENNIIHRDIKPTNILIRKLEPIDLILTDFGIASILEPGFSRRYTTGSRTIIYSSPESITGVIGKEVDYWSLGIIILEIITGKHPYEEIDTKLVSYFLSTKPVPIAEGIEPKWERLLKGLLTRDVKKRWGYEQVNNWLKGETDIPVFFESEEEIQKALHIPYKIFDKEFSTPKELAEFVIRNSENWEEARKRLMRGQIKDWIQNELKDYNLATEIEDIITEPDIGADVVLFEVVYKMDSSLPLVFKGELLGTIIPKWDFNNLIVYLRNFYESPDEFSENLKDIIKYLFDKELFSTYLKLVGEKEHLEFITQLEDRVLKISELPNKAITFLLGLTGQESQIIKDIKTAISEKIYPFVEDFSTAQQISQDEITLDGESLLKIKTFIDTSGYSPDLLKEKYTPKNFKIFLQEIFKEKKTNGEQLILDILLNKLYSQYLKFKKSSTIEIKKIEDIELEIQKFKQIYEKALAYYILIFDKSEEIKQEILERYKDKLIDNLQMDKILNRIRNINQKNNKRI